MNEDIRRDNDAWRQIRRRERALGAEEAEAILKEGKYGILSTFGQDGFPYGVPVNYFYRNGHIYFHCAAEGHKMDNLASCPKVSFTVVKSDAIDGPHITTYYESAIAFGVALVVRDEEKKRKLLVELTTALAPGDQEARLAAERCAAGPLDRVEVVDIAVEHISGKAH